MRWAAERLEQAVVAYKPKVRTVAPPPEETPIIHSSAYLCKGKSRALDRALQPPSMAGPEGSDSEARKSVALRVGDAPSEDSFSGNALEWALHKADQQLNEVEAGSSRSSQAALAIVKGPAGQITLRTMQVRLTAAVGCAWLCSRGPRLVCCAYRTASATRACCRAVWRACDTVGGPQAATTCAV